MPFRILTILFLLLSISACAPNSATDALLQQRETLAESAETEADTVEEVTAEGVTTEEITAEEITAEADDAEATDRKRNDGQSDTDLQLAEFTKLVEMAWLENRIPGVAVAVVRDGEILLTQGFGMRDLNSQEPVTPHTLFHIGSTQKSMTAMLIATLVDAGVVTWDEPVVSFFPDFALADPTATEEVTLRHLLSMSSGIPATAEDDFDVEDDYAVDLFDLLADTPLNGAPGRQFEYSNIAASVAGYLAVLAANPALDPFTESAEDLLYAGYDTLLRQKILDPIGMTSATHAVETVQASGDYAAPHVMAADGTVTVVESEDFTGDPLAPSGALKASVLDMAAYLSTQIRGGIAPNGTRLLSADALAATWEPQIEDSESGGDYALGWSVYQEAGMRVIAHEGSFDNMNALLLFVPEKQSGLVLLANVDDPGDFFEVVGEAFITYTTEQ